MYMELMKYGAMVKTAEFAEFSSQQKETKL